MAFSLNTVALVGCSDYASPLVEGAVRRVVDLLGGMEAFVKPGQRVLLKPNLLSAHVPEDRVTTDPTVVRAVARMVLDVGGTPFIGDSPALASLRKIVGPSGMDAVCRELGLEWVEFLRPRRVPPAEGAVYRRLELAEELFEADAVINLPKLKTHSQMTLTLGVKNLFGMIPGKRKAEWHFVTGMDRDAFASLHLDIYRAVNPVLTILDGVWGMEGNGPANGVPKKMGFIAASRDAPALDVSVCRMLGVPLRSFPLYREAVRRGMCEADPLRIPTTGDPLERFVQRDFRAPERDSLGRMPNAFHSLTRRYLVSKPVHQGNRCVECGRCEEICPAGAVRVERGRGPLFDYRRCIRCYCCQEVCPGDAVGFRQGPMVRLIHRLEQERRRVAKWGIRGR